MLLSESYEGSDYSDEDEGEGSKEHADKPPEHKNSLQEELEQSSSHFAYKGSEER